MNTRHVKTRYLKAAMFAAILAALTWQTPLHAASHAAADLPAVDVNDGFAELVAAVRPAVVNISTTGHAPRQNRRRHRPPPQFEEFFHRFFGDTPDGFPFSPPRPDRQPNRPRKRKGAVGSGFIIAADGLVVTNHHVIEDADEIEVVFDDGSRRAATLKGRDPKTDLALLQVKTDAPLPYLKFGDSDAARVGDWVIAIGNSFGLGGTTTAGIISARGRDIQSGPLDDFIQIDAPINRGNSGGPLFNTRGEVIGVNSAIYSPNGGNVGIGFAIPSAMASDVIAQLRDKGVVQRGFLGVHIQSLNEEIAESLGLKNADGALVTQVSPDSPAEKAGIEAGDVILRYDGKAVKKIRDLTKQVARSKKGERVNIAVWRNERRKTLRVTVGVNEQEQAPLPVSADASEPEGLGFSVGELDAQLRKQHSIEADSEGVVVTDVDANGTAAERGLRVGDLIKRIGNKTIATPDEVEAAVAASRKSGKKSVLILIERNQRTRFIVIPMSE